MERGLTQKKLPDDLDATAALEKKQTNKETHYGAAQQHMVASALMATSASACLSRADSASCALLLSLERMLPSTSQRMTWPSPPTEMSRALPSLDVYPKARETNLGGSTKPVGHHVRGSRRGKIPRSSSLSPSSPTYSVWPRAKL